VPKSIFLQHQFLDNLLNKQGFFRSPEQKDEAIKFASSSRFKELYGSDATYQPGFPLPPRAYQVTQAVADSLQPFLRERLFVRPGITFPPDQLPTDLPAPEELVEGNKFKLPADWVHPTAMHFIEPVEGMAADFGNYLYPHAGVKVLNDDKAGKRRRSLQVAPTQSFPIATVVSGAYRIIPAPNGLLYVKYLGRPANPLFAYTVEDGQIVYDDEKSVDTGWPESEENTIMLKAAEVLGVPIQDPQLVNFARSKAQSGG
jgi:hypothetical protein